MKKILAAIAWCLLPVLLLGCGSFVQAPSVPAPPPTVATEPPVPTNPYTPEDFVTEGDYLDCTAGESQLGIDVSYWQGQIDWQQVKDAGVEFVMIRVGWRGSGQGILAEDEYAQANYEGARAVGLKVGCYFFSQAITPQEAEEEADFLMERIRDWQLDMPVVYDWEYISADSRTGNVDARLLTDCTKAFCEKLRRNGYVPMIYFNADQSHKQMYLEELTDYMFWLAMYESEMNYPYKIHMWQYTNTGSVPGIEGNVDLNLYFTYEE